MADPAELIDKLLDDLVSAAEDRDDELIGEAREALHAALTPPAHSAEDVAVLDTFEDAVTCIAAEQPGPPYTETRAAVLARMAGEPTWQPIEAAPKDGFFLAYTPNFGGHCAVWKADLYWLATNRGTPEHLSGKGFTHWMPLPAAPESPR